MDEWNNLLFNSFDCIFISFAVSSPTSCTTYRSRLRPSHPDTSDCLIVDCLLASYEENFSKEINEDAQLDDLCNDFSIFPFFNPHIATQRVSERNEDAFKFFLRKLSRLWRRRWKILKRMQLSRKYEQRLQFEKVSNFIISARSRNPFPFTVLHRTLMLMWSWKLTMKYRNKYHVSLATFLPVLFSQQDFLLLMLLNEFQ